MTFTNEQLALILDGLLARDNELLKALQFAHSIGDQDGLKQIRAKRQLIVETQEQIRNA